MAQHPRLDLTVVHVAVESSGTSRCVRTVLLTRTRMRRCSHVRVAQVIQPPILDLRVVPASLACTGLDQRVTDVVQAPIEMEELNLA